MFCFEISRSTSYLPLNEANANLLNYHEKVSN